MPPGDGSKGGQTYNQLHVMVSDLRTDITALKAQLEHHRRRHVQITQWVRLNVPAEFQRMQLELFKSDFPS